MNCNLIVLRFSAVLISVSLIAAPAASLSGKARPKASGPKYGVKTPGVQIPFASLKSEAELLAPTKPAWLFYSDSLFAPAVDHLEKIDPKTNKKADPVAGLDRPCGGMVNAFGSLWTPVCGASGLARIDAKTLKATNTIETGVSSVQGVIAASADSIWLLTDDKTTLARIDPDQNLVVAEIRVPAGCQRLTFAETALWLACPDKNKILRINAATNLIEKQIEVSAQPESIAAGENSIWVLCRKEGKVDRVDPKTNKVTKTIELSVPDVDGSIVFGEGSLWATMTGFPLTRIEVQADTVTVAQQFYGDAGGAITISPGALWLSNIESGALLRIDPKRVRATLPE